jgi:thiamine kinase-like enzyme
VAPDVLALVRTLPEFADAALTIAPLRGGVTNRNYVVTSEDGGSRERRYVVRIPGERTELLGIDRANEAEAARRAASLGIGPPVIGRIESVGTLVTQLVPGVHLSADEFVGRLDEVVALLGRFHRSGPLAGRFPIFRVVEWHARDAALHGVPPPASYERLAVVAARIEAACAVHPLPEVPCHNDLLPGNLLFDGDRAWLLDFEYAGMNDPYFDLGNLAVNCGLTPDAEERLLVAYTGDVTRARWARLQLMKLMSELREGMWAVVQQSISTLDTDFVSYADSRLDSCERIAASADLDRWLADAAAAPA